MKIKGVFAQHSLLQDGSLQDIPCRCPVSSWMMRYFLEVAFF